MYPAVVAFYADRGVDLGYVDADIAGVTRLLALVRDHDAAELVSEEPPRVEVTFRCGDDVLELTLDETLALVATDG